MKDEKELPRLLTPREAAALRLSAQHLANLRSHEEGLIYCKIGAKVAYPPTNWPMISRPELLTSPAGESGDRTGTPRAPAARRPLGAGGAEVTPAKAIKLECRFCTGTSQATSSVYEAVRSCDGKLTRENDNGKMCWLHPYMGGKNPYRPKRTPTPSQFPKRLTDPVHFHAVESMILPSAIPEGNR